MNEVQTIRVVPSWSPEEEHYLSQLAISCEELSNRYQAYFSSYKALQLKFRIPNIIVSASLGLLSISNDRYEDSRKIITIVVGVSSAFLTVLNSVEGFLGVGQTMAGCQVTSLSFLKMAERIRLETALLPIERSMSGVLFLREIYASYEKTIESAPNVLQRLRFIGKPRLPPISQSVSSNFSGSPKGNSDENGAILSIAV